MWELGESGSSRCKRTRASMGWCPQCHKMRAECFLSGDWACAKCGQHNYAAKTQCTNSRCAQEREDVDLSVDQEEEEAPVRASSPWCISCRKLKADCWKLNDWECPWCNNHNYARKQVFNGNLMGERERGVGQGFWRDLGVRGRPTWHFRCSPWRR